VLSPLVLGAIDPTHAPLDQGQVALLAAAATFAGGGLAGLAGQNAMAGATAAQNEALNDSADHWGQDKSEAQREQDELHKRLSKEKAQLGEGSIVDEGNGVSVLSPNPMAFGGAAGRGNSAANAVNGLNLNKSLASQQQLSQLTSGNGVNIAGNGTNVPLRDAPRLVFGVWRAS
jgi:filamentous hemagglutinin